MAQAKKRKAQSARKWWFCRCDKCEVAFKVKIATGAGLWEGATEVAVSHKHYSPTCHFHNSSMFVRVRRKPTTNISPTQPVAEEEEK